MILLRVMLFFMLLSVPWQPVWAASSLKPPLDGAMLALEAFDSPVDLPSLSVTDATGLPVELESTYANKIRVVNLWATWCPPCIKELPSLNALQRALGDDQFQVIAVSIDQLSGAEVQKFLTEKGIDQLPALIDTEGDFQTLEALKDLRGIPTTLILDPSGNMLARYQGDTDWNSAAVHQVIEYYLKNVTFKRPYNTRY